MLFKGKRESMLLYVSQKYFMRISPSLVSRAAYHRPPFCVLCFSVSSLYYKMWHYAIDSPQHMVCHSAEITLCGLCRLYILYNQSPFANCFIPTKYLLPESSLSLIEETTMFISSLHIPFVKQIFSVSLQVIKPSSFLILSIER